MNLRRVPVTHSLVPGSHIVVDSNFIRAKKKAIKRIPELSGIFLKFYELADVGFYNTETGIVKPVDIYDVLNELKDLFARIKPPKENEKSSDAGGTNLFLEYNKENNEFCVSFYHKKYI